MKDALTNYVFGSNNILKDKIKVTLRKIDELEDALHPNNIMVGNSYTGILIRLVRVGEACCIVTERGSVFHTSTIQSIEGNRLITLNSIYEITYH